MKDKQFEISAGEQTARAASESQHLQKTLGRLDIVFLIVAAVVSIEVLGQVSSFGGGRRSRGRWCSRSSSWCPTA